jgi:hypothetical protein
MRLVDTSEGPTDPVGELVSAEQSLRLDYLAFAVDPLGLYSIEPGTPGRQKAGNYPYSSFATTIFDLAVVGGDPTSKVVAFMPGGVVSDQMQGLRAPLLELLAAPSKKPRGYGAHRPTYSLREAPSTRYVIVISRHVRAFSLDRFTRHFRDNPLADVPDASGWFHTLGADPID